MCPTPTNPNQYTTQDLPTPTPTYENIKKCGRINSDSGKGVFTYIINLSNSPSTVVLNYNTYTIPDRFVVEIDNTIVADTGYVGDKLHDDDLLDLGLPITSGPGQGSISFNNIKKASLAYLTVYAPLPNSSWSFLVECNAPPITPTSTPAITYTATCTPMPTPTTSPTPVKNVIGCGTCFESGSGVYTYRIQHGLTKGTFGIAYDTYTIPDNFTIINGSNVYSTGFVGDASYNSDLQALGYPEVSGPGAGAFVFNAIKDDNITLTVNAPLSGTMFTFTVMCPTPTPTPSNTPGTTPTSTQSATPLPTPYKTSTPVPTNTPTSTPTDTPCPTPSPSITSTPATTPTQTPTVPALSGAIIFVEVAYSGSYVPVIYSGLISDYDWRLHGCQQVWDLWGHGKRAGLSVTLSAGVTLKLVGGDALPATSPVSIYEDFVEDVVAVPPMPAGGAPYTKFGSRDWRENYIIYIDKWVESGILAPGQPIRYNSDKYRWWSGAMPEFVNGVTEPLVPTDYLTGQGRFDAQQINIAARMFAWYYQGTGVYYGPMVTDQLGATQRITHPGDFGEANTILFNIVHMPGTDTFTLGLGPI